MYLKYCYTLLLTAVYALPGSDNATKPPFNTFTEAQAQQSNVALSVSTRYSAPLIIRRSQLPSPNVFEYKYSTDNATTQLTLLQVLFLNNKTLLEASEHETFAQMDTDSDGRVSLQEMTQYVIDQNFDGKKMSYKWRNTNLYSKLHGGAAKPMDVVNSEFAAMDSNADGYVSLIEY